MRKPGEVQACFFIDALVSAGASLASGWLANQQRKDAAKEAFNRQLQAFGQRYQLQMADMRAAGLNPILSYRQAPPGMPSAPMPMVENIGLTSAQSTQASSAAALNRQHRLVQKEVANRERATTENLRADTSVKNAEEILRGTKVVGESIRNRIAEEELVRARAGSASARHSERIYESDVGPALRWLDELMRIARGRGGPRSD